MSASSAPADRLRAIRLALSEAGEVATEIRLSDALIVPRKPAALVEEG